MTNEIVAQLRRPPSEAQPANVTSLPTAVQEVMAELKQAIGAMRPDDVSIELTASQDANRSNARFSFRAFRRGRAVASEERDV